MRVPAVIRFDGQEYAGWLEVVEDRMRVSRLDGRDYTVPCRVDLDGEFDCPPGRVQGEALEAQAGGFILPVIVSHYDEDKNTVRVKSNGNPREATL